MMKRLCMIAVLWMWACMIFARQQTQTFYEYEELYKNLPFEMPRVEKPVFPDYQISVADCGGCRDGVKLNTVAFERGMEMVSQHGGGKLVVPAGVWLTGPVVFRSNVNLHLEKGALLLFTTDYDAYPLVRTVFEGQETSRCQSPVSGDGLENIAITGKGAINGSGQAWRPLKRSKVTEGYWKKVTQSGGYVRNKNVWWPTAKSFLGDSLLRLPGHQMTEQDWTHVKDYLRPVLISFVNCKNVWLEGVLFENSPGWNVHPLMCENVIVDGVTIRNPSYAQNGDGLDLESCKNVIVVNSTLDVGDDAICLKSGRDEEGRRRGKPTENVIVDNCRVFNGHGGFVVGSEMSGGVRNVCVSNCVFTGTDVGLRFKSCRGRGGVVENIYIDRISMYNISGESFLFDLYYGRKMPADKAVPAVSEDTPVFRNIYVSRLSSSQAGKAMLFNGLPEMNIENIHIENAVISSRLGARIAESDGIYMKNVQLFPEEGPAIMLHQVKNLELSDFDYPDSAVNAIEIDGKDSRHIALPAGDLQQKIKVGKEVKREEIKYIK